MNFDIYLVYYFEIDVLCITFLLIMLKLHSYNANDTYIRIFRLLIIELVIYCISDIIAAHSNKQAYPCARAILTVSNSIYIVTPLVVLITWEIYVFTRLQLYGFRINMVDIVFRGISGCLITLTMLSPITQFAFYINDNNEYQRSVGSYIIAIFCIIYGIYITIKAKIFAGQRDNAIIRTTINTFSYFLYPPIITSILQLSFYGIAISQVGFTCAIFLVFAYDLRNQVSKDSLTGLNNRNEFYRYVNSITDSASLIFLALVDIDDLQKINMKYGSVEGDRTIKETAKLIGIAVSKCCSSLFISRYDSGEFAILGVNIPEEITNSLYDSINRELAIRNNTTTLPYPISVSYGYTYGELNNSYSMDKMYAEASKDVYKTRCVHSINKI